MPFVFSSALVASWRIRQTHYDLCALKRQAWAIFQNMQSSLSWWISIASSASGPERWIYVDLCSGKSESSRKTQCQFCTLRLRCLKYAKTSYILIIYARVSRRHSSKVWLMKGICFSFLSFDYVSQGDKRFTWTLTFPCQFVVIKIK